MNAPISNKLLSTALPSIEDAGAAVAEALGEAYDCHRVWHAWGVGTMTQDDFSLVGDDPERVVEIAGAVLDLCRGPFELLQAQVATLQGQVKALQADPNSYQSGYDYGRTVGTKFAHHERARLVKALDELEREHRKHLATLLIDPASSITQAVEFAEVSVANLRGKALEWAVEQPSSDKPKTFGCHHVLPTCSLCEDMVRSWLGKALGGTVKVPTGLLEKETCYEQ